MIMVWPYPEGHTCRTCRRVFVSALRCQEHERVEHPPTLCCSACSKKEFLSGTQLLAHLESHLPLVCFHSRCGALITNIHDLIAHRAVDRLQIAPPGYAAMQASAKTMSNPVNKVPASPIRQFVANPSPVSTPKRKFTASPNVTSGYRTPTLKTPKGLKPRASTLTPAFNQLRLAGIMSSPINETLFQSCLMEEDDEMMLSAVDTSTPQF